MNSTEALESIERSNPGNARIEALRDVAGVVGVKELIRRAVDNSITFGIKKLPPTPPTGKTLYEIFSILFKSDEEWCDNLVELLDKLATRKLSGKAAAEEVSGFLSKCDGVRRKWAERIILKDLRLGLDTKSVNKAIPGLVFEFGVPLATDYAKLSDRDLRGNWVVQHKLDGARCVAYLYGDGSGRVELKSRSGKSWDNFESIRRTLKCWNRDRIGSDLVADGEVVSLDGRGKPNFNQIQQTLHAKKRGTEIGTLQYVVFDLAIREEWEGARGSRPYRERYDFAKDWTLLFPTDGRTTPRVTLVQELGFLENPRPADLMDFNRRAVLEGYEGAMARKTDSTIKLKRTKDLIKVKAFQDAEAEIVGAVEGTGKYVGMLGALKCRTPGGVEFEIGSGFDDKTRTELWCPAEHDRDRLIGQQVKYKLFEVSKDGVPRFPIYLGLRHPADQ